MSRDSECQSSEEKLHSEQKPDSADHERNEYTSKPVGAARIGANCLVEAQKGIKRVGQFGRMTIGDFFHMVYQEIQSPNLK